MNKTNHQEELSSTPAEPVGTKQDIINNAQKTEVDSLNKGLSTIDYRSNKIVRI